MLKQSNKLCECGCGCFTHFASADDPQSGVRKGEARRFLRGHNSKIQEKHPKWKGGICVTGGYVMAISKNHPRAHEQTKRIAHHILIVEKAFGRILRPPEQVHHVDGNKLNNENANLVLCPDRTYHMLLHIRAEARRVSGNPNNRKCCFCKSYDAIENLQKQSQQEGFFHRSCKTKWQKEYRKSNGKPDRKGGEKR